MNEAFHWLLLAARFQDRTKGRRSMLSEPVLMRSATVDDIPFIRAMMREALSASPTFLAHQHIEALQQAEEQEWLKWQEHPTPVFVAVDATGRNVGALRLRPHHTKVAQGWQLGIGVEAEARNRGIGRRLVEHAINYASATNAPYLNLMVDPTNLPAIALYRRTGFVEIGEHDNVIEMRLTLSEHAT